MKALTLTQPWATLVMAGVKRIETRSWQTSHRGRIAIHAAKAMDIEAADLAERSRRFGLIATKPEALPRGVLLGYVTLVNIVATEAVVDGGLGEEARRRWPYTEREDSLGDFSPGRFAWLLEDPFAIPVPVPMRGALGLWELPA